MDTVRPSLGLLIRIRTVPYSFELQDPDFYGILYADTDPGAKLYLKNGQLKHSQK
jgi:hypothetical protein